MSGCSNFSPHIWKKDFCINCFHKKSTHPIDSVSATELKGKFFSARRQYLLDVRDEEMQPVSKDASSMSVLTSHQHPFATNKKSSAVVNEHKDHLSNESKLTHVIDSASALDENKSKETENRSIRPVLKTKIITNSSVIRKTARNHSANGRNMPSPTHTVTTMESNNDDIRTNQYQAAASIRRTTSQISVSSTESGSSDTRPRSREESPKVSRLTQTPPCKSGKGCFNPICKFDHPPGRKVCEDGESCRDYYCKENHSYKRMKLCRFKNNCRTRNCKFLHPMSDDEVCQARDECQIWDCEKWHPKGRPNKCLFGKQCYNPICQKLHPTARNLCSNGIDCKNFDCQLDHPASRTTQCNEGSTCSNYFCTFLHPNDWDPCEQGSECSNPNCPHTNHPPDRILQLQGKNTTTTEQNLQTYSPSKSLEQRNREREENQLPILAAKEEFCQRLKKERILVVTAETGSGKSTQLPQYAAEYFGGLIVCTQPRVIAAISLARRVAKEYDGSSVGLSVGYRVGSSGIGKDKNRVPGTNILFMTDGTFVQESQTNYLLNEVQVLIIDEAHERSLNTDIVLGLAKRLLETRPTDFYVVISSATIDPSRFLEYFQRSDSQPLNIKGRVYPVDVVNIPKPKTSFDKHLISTLEQSYNQHEGNILVFLPGQREIENAIELFNRKNRENCIALPLYAALSPEEQDRVLQFDAGEDGQLRMIVFCTNIAETSLTIENVRLVIDSGLAKEAHFDHKSRLTVIETVIISRASADQRKGRAGRTAPGCCIRLYENDDLVRPNIIPEILRAQLDLIVLQLIRLRLEPQKFPFMDPPSPKSIQASLDLLKDLSCIDEQHTITQKGELFGKLGIEPRLSAFLVSTYLEHESMLELITRIVAILASGSSVFSIIGETQEEKESGRKRVATNAKEFDSDLIYSVETYKKWVGIGIIDQITRICPICRIINKRDYACGPCRAAYSRTHLLNNKTLNYAESLSETLMTTLIDPRWQLKTNSLTNANESTIIGKNLLEYFPERYGHLVVKSTSRENAYMINGHFHARISDISAFYERQDENVHFIAMSVIKVPGNIYIIDRLHLFNDGHGKNQFT